MVRADGTLSAPSPARFTRSARWCKACPPAMAGRSGIFPARANMSRSMPCGHWRGRAYARRRNRFPRAPPENRSLQAMIRLIGPSSGVSSFGPGCAKRGHISIARAVGPNLLMSDEAEVVLNRWRSLRATKAIAWVLLIGVVTPSSTGRTFRLSPRISVSRSDARASSFWRRRPNPDNKTCFFRHKRS